MPKNTSRRVAGMAEKPIKPYKPIATEFLGQQKPDIDLTVALYSSLENGALWRNNLVAASKHHNYLFIAQRSEINVYMPTYPYQTLSEEPFTVLLSDQLTPSRGYIDQRNPHSINSLTIGELGTEEVLVSAHDDGDVCVWYTRDLKRIALRYNVGLSAWGVALHKEKRLLAISANSHKITVFELAVGREEQNALDEWERRLEERNDEYAEGFCGRRKEKVAVSGSVRGRRTSMKRPSQHDSAESNSSDYEDGRWAPRRKSRKRRKEQPAVQEKGVKVLEGHTENIPNISFLPDSSGRWLVGTSIDGMVILWDVHTQRMVERCKFGFMLRGWSVVFMAPEWFKPVNSMYEALDKSPSQVPRRSRRHFSPHDEPVPDELPPRVYVSGVRSFATDYYSAPAANQNRTNEARAWDISPSNFYQTTQSHYEDEEEEHNLGFEEEVELHFPAPGEESDEETDEDIWLPQDYLPAAVMPTAPPPPIPVVPPPIVVPTLERGPDDEGEVGDESGSENSDSGDSISIYNPESEVASELYDGIISWGTISDSDDESLLDDEAADESIGELEGDADHEFDDTTSSVVATGDRPPRKLSSSTASSHTIDHAMYSSTSSDSSDSSHQFSEEEGAEPEPTQPPTSFIFSTTEHNAYLLPTTLLSPTVVCKGFLHQHFPSAMHQFLGQIDRLNMVTAIPELSLVVAGSQKGRVGIFRLTRSGDNFGMRLDTVLPKERGVETGELDVETRPPSTLLGVAVSPIQGKEIISSRSGSEDGATPRRRKVRQRGGGWRGVEGRRRWRLMLVYMDGSVLSYELGRESEEEGPGGLGELLGIKDTFVMV